MSETIFHPAAEDHTLDQEDIAIIEANAHALEVSAALNGLGEVLETYQLPKRVNRELTGALGDLQMNMANVNPAAVRGMIASVAQYAPVDGGGDKKKHKK